MKKLILLILAIGFIAVYSNAQHRGSDYRNNINYGLKAGINYSNVYDAFGEQFEADRKVGFVAGGFIAIPLGRYLGFQPELLFSQKGFQATGILLGSPYKFTRTTNFIDVPLLITLKPSQGLTLLAGPQYSYLMKQKDVFSTATYSNAQEEEFKNDNIRKNILCFIGGFDLNIQNIVLGGRVGWDLQTNNGDGTSSTPRYKNVWYQATLGIRF